MTALLGIDLGTTSFKAAAYDDSGAVLASARVSPPDETVLIDGTSVAVWTAERFWDTICTLTRRISDQLSGTRIDGVAVAELGLIGFPLDDAGRPLAPAITWLEPSAGAAAYLEGCGLDDATLFSMTGNHLNPIYPPAWIAWLKDHVPAVARSMVHWINVGDYIAYRLCGELAIDYSMASQTLSFDQHRLEFRRELLDAFHLQETLFPPTRQAGTPLGAVRSAAAADTGLAVGTPVVVGGADYICGGFGAGFVDPGEVAILSGTWEHVLMCCDRPRLDVGLGSGGAICDAHVVPQRWSVRIESLAGEVTEWYRERFSDLHAQGVIDPDIVWPALIERAQAIPPGSGGVIFIPFVFGSFGPRIDELARGAFIGLNGSTTRVHLMRAVFEGLSFHNRNALETFVEAMNVRPERIVYFGGGAKNELWTQVRADVLGRDLEVITAPDATPRGAAMLAGVGVGVFPDHAAAARRLAQPTVVRRYDPARAEYYTRMYQEVYLPLCNQLAPFDKRLAQLARPPT